METTVLNRQRGRRVATGGLSRFLQRLGAELGTARATSIALCLVSDRRMRQYNREFRGCDATTDVLSFPDGTPDRAGSVHLGDIVISVATAARQARDCGHSLPRELRVLALHGYLHLLGYDHERDRGEMMRVQRRIQRKLLPRRRRGA